MTVRTAAILTALGLMIAAPLPLSAMPLQRVTLTPEAQRVSLGEPSPRTLLIRRTMAPLAVEPEWGEGWGVPIIGSVRCLPAVLTRW